MSNGENYGAITLVITDGYEEGSEKELNKLIGDEGH
jgi:hypothetical protein